MGFAATFNGFVFNGPGATFNGAMATGPAIFLAYVDPAQVEVVATASIPITARMATFTAGFGGFAFNGPGSTFDGASSVSTVILLGEVDPAQTQVLPDDASLVGIDPTRVQVIQ